jgi:hypothetical protein
MIETSPRLVLGVLLHFDLTAAAAIWTGGAGVVVVSSISLLQGASVTIMKI